MKLFGPSDKLSEIAQLIMAEDIDALEKLRIQGLDINEKTEMTEYTEEAPIELALCENKYKVLDWLLSNNVELNDKDNPSILMACSNCSPEIVKQLIENGANVNATHRIGKTAMSAALYGEKYENISLLLENGYKMSKDGVSLRQAVSSQQMPAIEIFIKYGVDVNFYKPDAVYANNPSPVNVAAEENNLDIVKLLVENGANVTLKDRFGKRPYNWAVEHKNEDMMIYIKSLEPKKWHDEEQKLADLKKYKLPAKLLAITRSENRRFEFPENDHVKYIVFNSLLELKEVSWKKRKFIDLLSEVDDYWNQGFLVWLPKKKLIAFADYEHETFQELCTIKEFLANPEKQINKIFKEVV